MNVAYRYFLDLGLQSTLPHPSLLSVFRTRLQILDDGGVQTRQRLLEARRPCGRARMVQEDEQAARVRLATSELPDRERVAQQGRICA